MEPEKPELWKGGPGMSYKKQAEVDDNAEHLLAWELMDTPDKVRQVKRYILQETRKRAVAENVPFSLSEFDIPQGLAFAFELAITRELVESALAMRPIGPVPPFNPV
jgi:hypothetical protein